MYARQFCVVVAIAILAMAMGCARSGRSAPGLSSFDEIATARITNHGWLDVNVYGSRSGSGQRLGTVAGQKGGGGGGGGGGVGVGGLRIVIDAIGSTQTYQTDVIPAGPGQQIDVV